MAPLFRMERLPQKLMHGLAHQSHNPTVVSLQPLEQREVGLKKLWSVMSLKPHQCDQ